MIGGIVAALLVGFVVGLLAFKIKVRWCRRCGEVLCCPNSAYHVYEEAVIR